ncbi:MAG: hypothetical protein AAGL98_02695, partial [Planctomycetota bacterium]
MSARHRVVRAPQHQPARFYEPPLNSLGQHDTAVVLAPCFMKQLVTHLINAARRLLTQPLSELNRWQLTARYAVGIARYGAHELKEDRASQMAAALTYRTIFSLVPLFVLSLLVFNAFGGFASVGGELQDKIYDYLGLNAIT